MARYYDFSYIFATVALTVYCQIIIKLRVSGLGIAPPGLAQKVKFIMMLLLDPGIISGLLAALFASFSWMIAMTKFDLSFAYPVTSLSFVIILLLSSWLFSEPLTLQKVLGVSLIVIGTIISTRV